MGGGIRMGNTCKSMADSFQCMTNPTTIKKKIKTKQTKKQKKSYDVSRICNVARAGQSMQHPMLLTKAR